MFLQWRQYHLLILPQEGLAGSEGLEGEVLGDEVVEASGPEKHKALEIGIADSTIEAVAITSDPSNVTVPQQETGELETQSLKRSLEAVPRRTCTPPSTLRCS